MNHRTSMMMGAILGGLSVALGAFGAHLLHDLLEQNNRTEIFDLAVRYLFCHALALLIAGLLRRTYSAAALQWAPIAFLGGTMLFSGSLIALALTNQTMWASVTPFGGAALLAGWVLLVLGIIAGRHNQN